MKNNISQITNCYGCGVCAKSCGKKIIEIRLNSDGFYEPFITEDSKCNECGICLDVCAYLKNVPFFSSPQKSYAAWSKDVNIRKKASSGGISFEIAKILLNKNFKICSVRYNIETNRAEHYIANNINELIPSIGSKYIQSYTLNAFNEINRKDKYLIIGTPCQIDSVRHYIHKFKIEENFILIDFFCHGVPTMWAWTRYKEMIEKKIGSFSDVAWRYKDKDINWHDSLCMHIKGERKSYTSKATEGDLFYQLFFKNACLNKSCYSKCKYKYNHSSADIRIGDLWGKTYETNQEGVSALVTFTLKGDETIKSTRNIELVEQPFNIVAEGQIQKKLIEPKLTRSITLNLLKNRSIPIKFIIIIMKVLLKLFNKLSI